MGGIPKEPVRSRHAKDEEGRMTPPLPPFVLPGSLHAPIFCRMLYDPSVNEIKSLLSRRPNHYSSYRKDYEKHHTFLTMKLKQNVVYNVTNVVYNVTNVERHELHRFDADRPLSDMIPKRTNSLAVTKGLLSRFFLATGAAKTTQHVCQACFVIQAEKRQHNTFRASRQTENLELFKKPEPSAQFQCGRTFSIGQPIRPTRRTTSNFRYNSFWGWERSLEPRRLWSPYGIRVQMVLRPSAYEDL